MTPRDWSLSADSYALLEFLFQVHGSGSTPEQPRKLRLYFCSLARVVWKNLPGPFRASIEIAERGADDREFSHSAAALETLRVAQEFMKYQGDARDLKRWSHFLKDANVPIPPDGKLADWTADEWHHYAVLVGLPLCPQTPNFRWAPRWMHRDDLVRDIFEYPEELHLFDPAWRTAEIVTLARQMYRARDFGAMPMLGDKLEEAGCADDYFLSHCRKSMAPHARGCWLIDRILVPKTDSGLGLADDAE